MRPQPVSALYVSRLGPYPKLVVDWWGEERDAKLYDGPNPVVAHPPCGPWGVMRHLCQGQDPDCGPRAVEQVRTWGGVLEHPRGSTLFRAMGLPLPGESPDVYGGFTEEVSQCDWGHVARKRTWLYFVGVSSLPVTLAIREQPKREPTHWASGSRTAKRGPVPPGIKVCSAQQRNRTPPDFARFLVEMASHVEHHRAQGWR